MNGPLPGPPQNRPGAPAHTHPNAAWGPRQEPGYPPRWPPGNHGAPIPAPGPPHPSGSGRIVIVCVVAIAVAVLVIAVSLFVIGGGDSENAAPVSSTRTAAASSTIGEPSTYDLLDESGRAFPTLLPQGASGPRKTGTAYQNANCTAKNRGDHTRFAVEPLVSSPWVLLWDCEKNVKSAENPRMSKNYAILVYDSAGSAGAVVSALPSHTTEAVTKNQVSCTVREWRVAGETAPGGIVPFHTVNRVISFEGDTRRAAYLLVISVYGTSGDLLPSGAVGTAPPYAQDEVRAWWDAATL